MQDDLRELRSAINAVDEQLLQLLNQRATVALRIGKQKAKTGSPVYDPARERAVMERLETLNAGPLSKGAVDEIFTAIITACREIQGS